MKKITLIIISVISFLTNAQNIQQQSEAFKGITESDYVAFLAHKNGDKYIGGIDDKTYRIVSVKPEPNFPEQHALVSMINGRSDDKTQIYMPDDYAFPITYVANIYEGNSKMQKAIGYAPRQNPYVIKDRIVILDNYIYVITDWKDKDNYKLKAVLEAGKTPSGFKKMKLVMKSPKKMKELNPHKKLADYLNSAYALKESKKAEWLANSENKTNYEKVELVHNLVLKAMKKQNDDYMKSDEYKRIQEVNQYIENRDKREKVTLVNNIGKDVYLYKEGSRNATRLSNSYSTKVDCDTNYYYTFSSNSNVNGNGVRCYNANSHCGGKIIID